MEKVQNNSTIEDKNSVTLTDYLDKIKRDRAMQRVKRSLSKNDDMKTVEQTYKQIIANYNLKPKESDLNKLRTLYNYSELSPESPILADAKRLYSNFPKINTLLLRSLKTESSRNLYREIMDAKFQNFEKTIIFDQKPDPEFRDFVSFFTGYILAEYEGKNIEQYIELINQKGTFLLESGKSAPGMTSNIDTLRRIDKANNMGGPRYNPTTKATKEELEEIFGVQKGE